MARRVGILVEDAEVARCIYKEMLQIMSAIRPWNQPDVSIYSRRLPGFSFEEAIAEGAEVLRKTGVEFIVIPDQDLRGLEFRNIQNRVEIRIPKPVNQGDISLYAKFLVQQALPDRIPGDEVYSKDIEYETIERKKTIEPEALVHKVKDVGRHTNGFIGVHGGQGPESGNKALGYIAQQFNGAILLLSEASTPFVVDAIMQFEHSGKAMANPLPRLTENHRRLASVNPDVIIMTCNTAHYFFNDMVKGTKVQAVNIVDAAVEVLPEGAKALLLATKATVESDIFQDSIRRLGREDVALVIPDNAEEVDKIIWEGLVPVTPVGIKRIQGVIDCHETKLRPNGIVLAGCTEIGLALRSIEKGIKVVDSENVGCDKSIQVATAKAAKRSKPRKMTEMLRRQEDRGRHL